VLLIAKRTLCGDVALTAKEDQKPEGLQVAATGKQVQRNQICVHRESKGNQEACSDDPQFATFGSLLISVRRNEYALLPQFNAGEHFKHFCL
jgi:hypothetical protein